MPVERLCLHLELWLDGLAGSNCARKKTLHAEAAADTVECLVTAYADDLLNLCTSYP